MVELIVGKKGKGKTKVLLDKVNGAIKEANGSIVYLDKSTKHMYELNNKVRLIDVSVYPIKNADEFVGFVCGIISQDHDLEQVYLDSFLIVVRIVISYCKLTALACEVLRLNLLAVKGICYLYINRECLIGIALIVDISALGIPCELITIGCKALVCFNILDISQVGNVLQLLYALWIFQPVGNDCFCLVAGSVSDNINCFFLSLLFCITVRLISFLCIFCIFFI